MKKVQSDFFCQENQTLNIKLLAVIDIIHTEQEPTEQN